MNSKGQAAGVFKLLIGAVVGLTMIGIIYTLITQVESQKNVLDEEIYLKKLEMAIKNPTGQPFVIKNIKISKTGAITKSFLAERTGLKKGCFGFNCKEKKQQSISCKPYGIIFQKPTTFDLIITCRLGNDKDNNCNIECELKVK